MHMFITIVQGVYLFQNLQEVMSVTVSGCDRYLYSIYIISIYLYIYIYIYIYRYHNSLLSVIGPTSKAYRCASRLRHSGAYKYTSLGQICTGPLIFQLTWPLDGRPMSGFLLFVLCTDDFLWLCAHIVVSFCWLCCEQMTLSCCMLTLFLVSAGCVVYRSLCLAVSPHCCQFSLVMLCTNDSV